MPTDPGINSISSTPAHTPQPKSSLPMFAIPALVCPQTEFGPRVPVITHLSNRMLTRTWRDPLPGDPEYTGPIKRFFAFDYPALLEEEGGYDEKSWEEAFIYTSEVPASPPATPKMHPKIVVEPGTEDKRKNVGKLPLTQEFVATKDFSVEKDLLKQWISRGVNGKTNTPPFDDRTNKVDDSSLSSTVTKTPQQENDNLGTSLLGNEISRTPSRASSVGSGCSTSSRRSLRIRFNDKDADGNVVKKGKRLVLHDTETGQNVDTASLSGAHSDILTGDATHDEGVTEVVWTPALSAQIPSQAQIHQPAQQYYYLLPPTVPNYQYSAATHPLSSSVEQAQHGYTVDAYGRSYTYTQPAQYIYYPNPPTDASVRSSSVSHTPAAVYQTPQRDHINNHGLAHSAPPSFRYATTAQGTGSYVLSTGSPLTHGHSHQSGISSIVPPQVQQYYTPQTGRTGTCASSGQRGITGGNAASTSSALSYPYHFVAQPPPLFYSQGKEIE